MAAGTNCCPLRCDTASFVHAVNNRTKLLAAIEDESINFLEADIILQDGQAMMGHDNDCSYELSLVEFLHTCQTRDAGLGIKLDFKHFEALQIALESHTLANIQAPMLFCGIFEVSALLINADVLPADDDCRFFSDCVFPAGTSDLESQKHNSKLAGLFKIVMQKCPQVMLSLGWSTREEGGEYTLDQCTRMAELVKQIRFASTYEVPITYAVRGSWTQSSWDSLQLLMDDPMACLTVWSNVPVTAATLAWMHKTLPSGRTMYDLPDNSSS
jgi:hypothetical protein